MAEQESNIERKPIISAKKLLSQMEVGDEFVFHANGYIETPSKDSQDANGKLRKAFVNAKTVEIILDNETGEKIVYEAKSPVISMILLGNEGETMNIALSNSSSAFKLIKKAEYRFKKQTGQNLGHYELTFKFKKVALDSATEILTVSLDSKIGKRVYTPVETNFTLSPFNEPEKNEIIA